ncbi:MULTISPECIES: choice-of-anchor L domain-containing protein [Marivita]|uniref:Choice-of-anchor L domain-containing protein n=2 Tax=Marivita cryptomonadis TaxID=505252 RepID=A0A9Q2S2S2_9RHOB|nr:MULTISPECIES: choice-of-anchor L domain-containing protein [Marivita]MBM2322651.1 choice-of-anchor L domain-containing protein [Marivita cryptomonadis]MBM2332233.1 choice-of-anchor L domain-containing protein [Marivita cryptomonadis]MBM2341817.1 choice-of-anchor L domain-containing protein [Marivita cryptomonadis]MBM2346481.1 choice-of-anchor L domain-containing protein [Marivita cryptomonadis]MBM2351158.1 choice-of-anchor L domain-containing protein [Marivita cryptomonadis]
MPIATELNIAQTTDASLVADTIFGPGITVISSTLTGTAGQTGIYSDGLTTSPGVVPSDSGVIFSTGNVADFTNSSGTTDTNTLEGTSTVHGGAGDPDLTTMSGYTTFDAAIFEAVFIPDNDFLTMQFVFSSEEYLEFVNSGFNDVIAVMINGSVVELTPTVEAVSIDTVNTTVNSNLYVDNPAASDFYNTEMDGFTITMALKAPVNAGVENTIKIGVADSGDGELDSNFLIAANSLQTVAIAFADEIELEPNSPAVLDVLANDTDYSGQGLTITKINGVDVVAGDTVTFGTGEAVTLNSDGTFSVVTDGDLTASTFTYEVIDGNGITDVGYVTVTTAAVPDPDGYVNGTTGADLIDVNYTGDPQGDRVDNNDSLGVLGTSGDGDVINGFEGRDTILAGAGDDIVDGGADADVIDGGTGNDTLDGGIGFSPISYLDVANGQSANGNSGGNYFQWLAEPFSNATISLDAGTDGDRTGDGVADYILVATTNSTNTLAVRSFDYGLDKIVLPERYVDFSFSATRSSDNDYSVTVKIAYASGNSQTFNIEGEGVAPTVDNIFTTTLPSNETGANDLIAGGSGNDLITGNDGDDTLFGGTGEDTIFGGTGADSIDAGGGADTIYAGDGDDVVTDDTGVSPEGWADVVDLGDGNDVFIGTGYYSNDDDLVFGGAGNDTITVQQSYDTVYGGDGDDLINSTSELVQFGDQLHGDAGNDTINAETTHDTITGGSGNDLIDAGGGADVIAGGGGADTISGGLGNDTIHGDTPVDVAISLTAPVVGAGVQDFGSDSYHFGFGATVGGTLTYTLETEIGETYTLTFDLEHVGTEQGAHVLQIGNQTITIPADMVGAQSYTHSFTATDTTTTIVIEDATPNGDTVNANSDVALTNPVLSIVDMGADGADSIDAGGGDDLVIGGAGNDTLTGGDGDDTFVYAPGDGFDTISDFNVGNSGTLTDGDSTKNDRVDLSAYYDDIWELTSDYRDDGILNQSNDGIGGADYSDNTPFGDGGLVFTNGVASTSFFNVENTGVVCFVSGTRILTETGERLIDTLRVGDRIVTQDNGVQVLRWIGRRSVSQHDLVRNPKLLPIQLSPKLTGGESCLAVSPQHGVLLQINGEERLVRATWLADMQGGAARIMTGRREVTYLHLMFDQHQIVFANGAASESFYPGKFALAAVAPTARREIFALFPRLDVSEAQASYGASAREFAPRNDLPRHLRDLKRHSHRHRASEPIKTPPCVRTLSPQPVQSSVC